MKLRHFGAVCLVMLCGWGIGAGSEGERAGSDNGKVYILRPNMTADFFAMFEEDARWQRVMSRLDVFRMHLNMVDGRDWSTEGAKMMVFLRRSSMEVCAITGGLRAFSGCDGEEQGRRDLIKLDKLYGVGGVADQIVMDAAFRNSIEGFPNPKGLDLTIEEAAAEIVEYMEKIHSEYPDIKIGMNEPVPWYWWESYPEHMGRPAPDLKECMDAVLAACADAGEKLWFFNADCPYEYANDPPAGFDGWAKLVAIQEYLQGLGLPFGLMHNSRDGGNESDKVFFERTMDGLNLFLAAGGDPQEFAVQSWYEHPSACLPEDPDPLPQNEGDVYPITYLTKELMTATGATFPFDRRAFRITNRAGETVARIDFEGNLTLAGSLVESGTPAATSGSDFLVKNAVGGVVAAVDDGGNLELMGSVYESQGSLVAPAGSLVIKSGDEVVVYISSGGDLYLRGAVGGS